MNKYSFRLVAASLIFLIGCNRGVPKIESSSVCGEQNTAMDATYPDFITASRNLDIPYLNKTAANEAQRKFARALQLLTERQTDSSEALLLDSFKNADDALIRNEAKIVLQNMYLMESKWQDFLEIHPKPENGTDIYFSHAKAWSTGAPTAYRFPEQGITMPLTFTRNGQPFVHVEISGKSYRFILDTGAQFSTISRKVAEKCGIQSIAVPETDSESTFSNPGIVTRIELGNAEIENVPVMIIDSKNLDVKLLGLVTLMKIDGIIGWPQLKNLRLEFDRVHDILKIGRSEEANAQEGNFFYYVGPVIKATASNGSPLLFLFDSGKGYTSLYSRGARKTNIAITKKGLTVSSMVRPMGGTALQRRIVLKNAGFCIRNQSVKFNEIQIEKTENPFFDGWMGMDMGKSMRLVVDYPAGEFSIQNP